MGQITRYYIYGAGLLAMVTPEGEVYNYHYNATGSTVAITDQSQTAVNKYAYDPFGAVLNQVEAIPQQFKFVGQFGVMTEPNGFYYMRARYYDPKVGRFISEDPIGFGGGDVNLYAYVGNNPLNYIDANGLINYNRVLFGAVEAVGGAAGIGVAATSTIGTMGAGAAIAAGVAFISVPALAHGISEMCAGFVDTTSRPAPNVPNVSGPYLGVLAATGNKHTAEAVDLAANAVLLMKSVFSNSAPKLLDYISTAADVSSLANQAVNFSKKP